MTMIQNYEVLYGKYYMYFANFNFVNNIWLIVLIKFIANIIFYFCRVGVFSTILECAVEKKITEYSTLGATMLIGVPTGVTLRIKWVLKDSAVEIGLLLLIGYYNERKIFKLL